MKFPLDKLVAPLTLILVALATLANPSIRAQARVDFQTQILPIFETSCFRCHKAGATDSRGRPRKPKGELRLDGKGWIKQGGEDGPILSPGNASKSPLYLLVSLPEDDPDIMPAKGDLLTHVQQLLIRNWINQGADFGSWLGAGGPLATRATPLRKKDLPRKPTPRAESLLDQLARGARAAPASVLAKVAGELAQITPLNPGSPLLRVEFTAHGDRVGDRQVAALAPLAGLISRLDLGRTRVTDRSLATIRSMQRLWRLDLNDTSITDRGLKHLSRLPALRILNLYGTEVTDRCIPTLAALGQLERLYLWQTKLSTQGLSDLRQRMPQTRIISELKLPEPAPPGAERSGRRKRRRQK